MSIFVQQPWRSSACPFIIHLPFLWAPSENPLFFRRNWPHPVLPEARELLLVNFVSDRHACTTHMKQKEVRARALAHTLRDVEFRMSSRALYTIEYVDERVLHTNTRKKKGYTCKKNYICTLNWPCKHATLTEVCLITPIFTLFYFTVVETFSCKCKIVCMAPVTNSALKTCEPSFFSRWL